ncbi:hypothetical protein [Neptunicoccus sediminis]|uniref:hypothetical protein n=1 Tax=Neptunicoccus sediminis TaxID=1892596 RepID=UPI0009F3D959|nr:hypothetical protein [Neptunicoccus sediminis]
MSNIFANTLKFTAIKTRGRNWCRPASVAAVLFLSPLIISVPPQPASAQAKFLSAAQIKPILTATKGNWIAVREYDGQDLLYFTHLLSWRCGLTAIDYRVNNEETFKSWPIGTCNEDLSNPNALADDQKIYTGFPLGAIRTVTVRITYDDETTEENRYEREMVLLP